MKEINSTLKKKRGNLFLLGVIVLAIIFGWGGGAAALIILRPYLGQNVSPTTLTNQTDTAAQESLRQANSIIENAKKIIAGQENKINDTINSGQNSLVGVFKKNQITATGSPPAAGKAFAIADYYKLSDAIGEGIVVTSDGWILTSDFTKNTPESSILKNFVVITKTKDIYNIDKISQTGIDSYIFVHLANAKNLPVKSFVSKMDLTNSQSLVALNWLGESYLTSIVDKVASNQPVADSDNGSQDIIFANNLGDYFDNAFIFSLDGKVIGYFDKINGPVPLYNFQPLIKGLLQGKESQRASLGVSYVNLRDYAIKAAGYDQGALIYSDSKTPAIKAGSAAAVAGLQAGDIIISVDNTKIDALHDLDNILEKYSAQDEINLIYRRNGVENSVMVKLQALK
ncbi:MAG: PDZ domain-containing protein [Patescibacteria group bacterium]|nr:PDZ domain-containing protein [Patescibacteria group bacterium]